MLDLSYLLDHLASDPFFRHYRQLNEKLVQLIEDYSLVSFTPLNIQVQAASRDWALGRLCGQCSWAWAPSGFDGEGR